MRLDGIRVLDLTQLLPGPFGTQLLADMGAEVIKIEPPDTGDYARVFARESGFPGHIFAAVNNGKKSVTLDLQTDAGQAAFHELVTTADVVFEQFRPGVTERLGIDYETVREHKTDIIYCSLTGYGQEGPYRDRAGHDLNYIGFAGLLDVTRGDESEKPSIPGYPIADMSGGILAALSITGALLSRELGNAEGNYIDLAMTDAVLSYAQVEAVMANAGLEIRPGDTSQTGKNPSYGVYETSDGRYVTLAAVEPKFWQAFCEAIDRPDLREHNMSEDEETREWLRGELEAVFAERTWAEWEDLLGNQDDTMFGLVKTPTEAFEDPQTQSRDLLRDAADGHTRLGYPAQVADGLDSRKTKLPELGEHTESILRESGLGDEDIETLRSRGAI